MRKVAGVGRDNRDPLLFVEKLHWQNYRGIRKREFEREFAHCRQFRYFLVAGLRSRRGKSFELLQLIGTKHFDVALSVPLVMEYEDVLNRSQMVPLPAQSVAQIIDYLCAIALHQTIFYLWRPRLRDAKDDMVLELVMNAGAQFIITHNVKDFAPAAGLGISVLTPDDYLKLPQENKR